MSWNEQQTPGNQSVGGEHLAISYTESDGLLWLSVKNFLLTVVTLSIYRFWGKTNVRRHIWANISINGEALEYTGTGKELFLGALIVFGILGIPIIALLTTLEFMYGSESPITLAANMLLFLLILVFYGMAIYRARRYRLSRTLWRGIRGTLTGSPTSFSFLYFGAILLQGMTLGWSSPAMNLNIQERMIGDMRFGEAPFRFRGLAGPLYKRYALCWFLTPVVIVAISFLSAGVFAATTGLDFEALRAVIDESATADTAEEKRQGIAAVIAGTFAVIAIFITYSVLWTFYTAREMNIFASYTSFENATFKLDATVPSLVTLWLGNLVIMIFTLGIGQPYVLQRLMRYICNRLTVDGTVNVAAIEQSSAAMDKRGEGLVEAFDIDAF